MNVCKIIQKNHQLGAFFTIAFVDDDHNVIVEDLSPFITHIVASISLRKVRNPFCVLHGSRRRSGRRIRKTCRIEMVYYSQY